MHHLRSVYKFIQHFLTAKNTGGYGVHSPYIFQFTHYVLQEKNTFYIFEKIEILRKKIKKDNRILNITDLGTRNNRKKSVASIAVHSLKSAKHAQLLFRIANYFKAKQILELGTSLGLSTSYLASSSTDIHCVSMEGCSEIAKIAQENFNKLSLENIEIVVGNIDETLEKTLEKFDCLDLIFIDANHKYDAVVNYFEKCLPKMTSKSVMIIDDIYWSKGMEHAWEYVKNHPKVNSTIDLFEMGIVFFNDDLKKKHYKMRY